MVTVSTMMETMQKWRWICSPSPNTEELRGYSPNQRRCYLQIDLELPEFRGSIGIPRIMVEASESEFPPPTESLRQFSISEPRFVWGKIEMMLFLWKEESEITKINTSSLSCTDMCLWMSVYYWTLLPPSDTAFLPRQCVQVTILHSQTVAKLRSVHEFQLWVSSNSWVWHFRGQSKPE